MKELHQSKVIAVIPARYASRRFPAKMLSELNGKPLIQCVYENAKRCSRLDEIIIATDDERIFDVIHAFGGNAVMTPLDCLTGTDRIVKVLESRPDLAHVDLILNLQGDEPCMEVEVMTRVIEELEQDLKAVMATAVVPIKTEQEAVDPHFVKCILDENYNAIYFSRGLIPHGHLGYNPDTTYYGHLGIYCYKKEFLMQYGELEPTPLQMAEDLEQLKVIEHGYRIKAAVVESQSIGVDTPEDLKKVEQLLLWKKNSSLLPEESAPL